jgi:phosphoribosylamine--glycine ligase
MRVLVVGSGGREHALVRKLLESPHLSQLFVWPGNVMSQKLAPPFTLDPAADWDSLLNVCKSEKIDLVVVGPEKPLSEGLADALDVGGVAVFGPTRAAALLESSKEFAKQIMTDASVPTAEWVAVQGQSDVLRVAREMLGRKGATVLKASGLAAGKGVFVCHSENDVHAAVERLHRPDMLGSASTVVVEECLVGRECSYFVFVGECGAQGIGFAVDYKRLRDGDEGPNTGGMGCYAPVPWLPADAASTVDRLVVKPVLAELNRRGISYRGCLYVGLMWTSEGPKVIEFNVRLGDPEAEVLALQDERDWLALILRQMGRMTVEIPPQSQVRKAVTVVMAAAGYPWGDVQAQPIIVPWQRLESEKDLCVFGASIGAAEAGVKTGSGRVFAVTAAGASFAAARQRAYHKVGQIAEVWPGCQYRTDIGKVVAATP